MFENGAYYTGCLDEGSMVLEADFDRDSGSVGASATSAVLNFELISNYYLKSDML